MLQRIIARPLTTPVRSIRPFSTVRCLRQEQQQPHYQPPDPQTAQQATRPNPHRELYRSGGGRAIAYNFLIAMATFQVLYWSWLKLESMEVKKEKTDEIQSLECELKSLTAGKASK